MTRDGPIRQARWHRLIDLFQVKLAQVGTLREIITLLHNWMDLAQHPYRAESLRTIACRTQQFQHSTASWMKCWMLCGCETVTAYVQHGQHRLHYSFEIIKISRTCQ